MNQTQYLFLENRAGKPGGDEAAIFSVFISYCTPAMPEVPSLGQVEILNAQGRRDGGYKESFARSIGDGAYSTTEIMNRARPSCFGNGFRKTKPRAVFILQLYRSDFAGSDEIDQIEINRTDIKMEPSVHRVPVPARQLPPIRPFALPTIPTGIMF